MGVKDVFRDLYNLEINLIESEHMTGRKMESFATGMAQTVNKYAVFLHDATFRPILESGDQTTNSWDRVEELVTSSDATYSAASFQTLTEAAEQLVRADQFDDDELCGVAIRILGVSQQLRFVAARRWGDRAFLDDVDPADLTDAERLQIRKAWDIGTNIVVMQTVAQLDGDTVVRITPSRATKEYETLHQLNQQLLSTSLDHWRVLFETVANLTRSTFAQLLGR